MWYEWYLLQKRRKMRYKWDIISDTCNGREERSSIHLTSVWWPWWRREWKTLPVMEDRRRKMTTCFIFRPYSRNSSTPRAPSSRLCTQFTALTVCVVWLDSQSQHTALTEHSFDSLCGVTWFTVYCTHWTQLWQSVWCDLIHSHSILHSLNTAWTVCVVWLDSVTVHCTHWTQLGQSVWCDFIHSHSILHSLSTTLTVCVVWLES